MSPINGRTAELEVQKHVKYILAVEKKKGDFESVMMGHLRINGAYWGLTTLDTLDKLEMVDIEEVVSWVMKCQHESGGFGGNIGHDPHVLYTLSAVQILALFDKINMLDIDRMSSHIAGLQNKDGSFSGDIWGEVDTCFLLCGGSCNNGSLHHVDNYLLGWWLCERQVKSGGLNGRPEKLHDVCYSWWVLTSLIMIDGVQWIDKEKLVRFILDCQVFHFLNTQD